MAEEKDHWDNLAMSLRNLFAQTDDERLAQLYRKLLGKGWNNRIFPLSTKNCESEMTYAVLDAISHEMIEREKSKKKEA
jgi:hypothetical protein